jgi:hypothetical protein
LGIALVTGSAMLLHEWSGEVEPRQAAQHALIELRAHLTTLLVAGATFAAAGILAIVALHVLTD